MAKILQFSEAEKDKVGLTGKKKSTVSKLVSYLPSFVSNLPSQLYQAAQPEMAPSDPVRCCVLGCVYSTVLLLQWV